jgi:hypothetical protein
VFEGAPAVPLPPLSMIRKSGYRFSPATNAKGVCAEIMLKQQIERDDD